MRAASPVLTVLIAASSLAASGLAQRVPDTMPSSAQVYGTQPDFCAANGVLYLTWMDMRNGDVDIYFNRSTDGGRTWLGNDIRIDTGSAAGSARSSDPKIAVSGDTVVICWHDQRDGSHPSISSVYCNRSLDGGLTWLSTDVRVNNGVAPGLALALNQSITCVGNEVTITWEDTRNGDRDVYFSRSLDGGATWPANDIRIDTGDIPGSANSVFPRHAIRGDDVHVVWSDFRNGFFTGDIYYNRSLDGGATWLPAAVQIDNSTTVTYGGANAPRLAVADDSVYVIWADNPSDPNLMLQSRDVFFNRSLDRGTTWMTSDIRLNNSVPAGTIFTESPDICAVGDNVFTVWIDRRMPRTVAFNRSDDAGSTWLATDVPISHPPAGSFASAEEPRIVASGPLLLATWSDNRSGEHDVYANTSSDSGVTWLPADQRLDTGNPPGAASSSSATPALDSTAAYVAWRDNRSGSPAIFVNLPFGYFAYGDGLAGSGGFTPELDGQGLTKLGQTCSYPISNALGGAPSVLVLGTQKAAAPILGGTVLVEALVTSWVPLGGPTSIPGAGTANPTITLPNSPTFVGFSIFGQLLVLDPAAPFGLSMSAGLELWIG